MHNITAAELIAFLQTVPGDRPVVIGSDRFGDDATDLVEMKHVHRRTSAETGADLGPSVNPYVLLNSGWAKDAENRL